MCNAYIISVYIIYIKKGNLLWVLFLWRTLTDDSGAPFTNHLV